MLEILKELFYLNLLLKIKKYRFLVLFKNDVEAESLY